MGYAKKIEPRTPSVRNLAVRIVQPYDSGGYWNWQQPAAIFDWVSKNISYVPDPQGGDYAASASETLRARGGDCEDHAILVASLCEAIGISARVAACSWGDAGHALCQVRMGTGPFDEIVADLRRYYQDSARAKVFSAEQDPDGGIWVFADTAGASYFGDEGLLRTGERIKGPHGIGWRWTVPVEYSRHADSVPRHDPHTGPAIRPTERMITIAEAAAEGILSAAVPASRQQKAGSWRDRMRQPRG